MKTALEILNLVEPNGELLDTDTAIEAMEKYADQFRKPDVSGSLPCNGELGKIIYALLSAVLHPLYYMPCIKFKRWAISGRAILDDDLWNNKLARVGVWKKYFLIYDDYQHGR